MIPFSTWKILSVSWFRPFDCSSMSKPVKSLPLNRRTTLPCVGMPLAICPTTAGDTAKEAIRNKRTRLGVTSMGGPLLLPTTFCRGMITRFCAITMMAILGSFLPVVKGLRGALDLKLLVKFNLLLIVVFGLGLLVIAYQARGFLE